MEKPVEASAQVVNKKDIELPKDDSQRGVFILNLSREEQLAVLSKLTRDERLMCVKDHNAESLGLDPGEMLTSFGFKQTGVVVMGGAIDTIEQGRAWVPKGALSIEKMDDDLIEIWT